MIQQKYNIFFLTTIIIAVGFFLFPNLSHAASLQVSTDKSQYQVGDKITARISLSTTDAANATAGSLTFSSDKLRPTSISKSGSIVTLWVKEPAYSGSSVSFEGVIPNPGFTGSGRVLTVTFTATTPGAATISFASGSILANDGQGTELLSSMGRASLTIAAAAVKTETTKPATPSPVATVAGETPSAPQIYSNTTPDATKWYNIPATTINWSLPDGITDVSYSFDNNPTTDPTEKSLGLAESFTSSELLTDGSWYFHLKYKNAIGWSPAAHFAIQIDDTNPDSLAVDEAKDSLAINRAKFIFDATDKLSGIDRVEFRIDVGPAQIAKPAGPHSYFDTPDLASGKHLLTVRAIDLAGNATQKQLFFQIKSSFLARLKTFLLGNVMSVVSITISLITLLLTLLFIILAQKSMSKKILQLQELKTTKQIIKKKIVKVNVPPELPTAVKAIEEIPKPSFRKIPVPILKTLKKKVVKKVVNKK